jgi:hypothetical protein
VDRLAKKCIKKFNKTLILFIKMRTIKLIHTEFIEHDDFLYIKCSQNSSVDSNTELLDKVVDFIRDGEKDKFLFDIREPLLEMSDDDHLVCSQLLSYRSAYLNKGKIAFLANPGQPISFLSDAYSSGFTSFVEIDNADDASIWFSNQVN